MATQEEVWDFLEQRKIPFRSLWIANVLVAEVPSYEVLVSLASLPKVCRLLPRFDVGRVLPVEEEGGREERFPLKQGPLQVRDPEWNIEMVGAVDVWNVTTGFFLLPFPFLSFPFLSFPFLSFPFLFFLHSFVANLLLLGENVVIGIIDGGVSYTHEALKDNYRGLDQETGKYNHDYNWYDPVYNATRPTDTDGLPTFVL